jgi:hypothetical protein
MRRNIFSSFPIIVFLFVFIYSPQLTGKETTATSPIYLAEESFEFSPVLDGQEVQHDFIIFNRGTSVLDLLNVKPDCGCTTVSFPKQISPSGKGAITIRLKTTGYGGEHVVKTIAVRTNDSKRPEFNLAMVGDIRPLADINPPDVKLTGTAGRDIKQTITIAPIRENPFKILEAKAEKGKDIRLDLIQVKNSGGLKYHLTVYNIKQDKGWYIDNIYLKTNSKLSPVLKVRVFGLLRDKS